ncbi:MAG: hypothetical protein LBJ96_02190 [Holosporaceae bacterium]|nr:hypothetical protein [Holosporaceae bacterium]
MRSFVLCCVFASFAAVHGMDVDANRIEQRDAMALSILAFVKEVRLWEDNPQNFSAIDLGGHINKVGLSERTITLSKESLNGAIRNLHAIGSLPQYFIPTSGNTEDIEQYLIH